MPIKRRRTRIIMPPKARSNKYRRTEQGIRQPAQTAEDDEYGTPRAEEWTEMVQYKSFVVEDEDGEQFKFTLGQDVLVVPHNTAPNSGMELRDYWVGRIRDIRSRNDSPSDVWAKVQWYWSAKDFADSPCQIDSNWFGQMERVRSNSYDFVHSSCFQYYANVRHFDESELYPEYIGDETFYHRYDYNVRENCISRKAPLCICKRPYVPHKDRLLHFCPRVKCGKAYHAECLVKSGFIEPPEHHNSRAYRLERTLPESSTTRPGTCETRIKREVSPLPNKPKKRGRPPKKGVVLEPKFEEVDIPIIDYESLPVKLLSLARSPMVRGVDGFGVVGNVRAVAEARVMVDLVLYHGGSLPGDWRDKIQECGDEETVPLEWIADDLSFTCPSCGGAI